MLSIVILKYFIYAIYAKLYDYMSLSVSELTFMLNSLTCVVANVMYILHFVGRMTILCSVQL